MNKICIFCKHFNFNNAYSGYSEYTPGGDASIYCGKGHWDLDMFDDNINAFREKLKLGETCLDFQEDATP